ncbi:hypothetical protein INR49_016711 [Caranx melampygus]|nr:hypothetical protein INR49_016711 [Caranx melampygus]
MSLDEETRSSASGAGRRAGGPADATSACSYSPLLPLLLIMEASGGETLEALNTHYTPPSSVITTT